LNPIRDLAVRAEVADRLPPLISKSQLEVPPIRAAVLSRHKALPAKRAALVGAQRQVGKPS